MSKLPTNIILLGLGSKARNGKDTVANLIKQFESNVYILHWADKLYEEVKNKDFNKHNKPLIRLNEDYNLIEIMKGYKKEGRTSTIIYDTFTYDELPEFVDFMKHCPDYNYMLSKDPILLQIWGTNLRRNFFGNEYWVNRTFEDIYQITKNNKTYAGIVWICVADTRFRNEAAAIRTAGGLYIDIVRLTEDGTRFIAPDRDPMHPSESDLNNTKPDFIVKAKNLEILSDEVKKLLQKIKQLKGFT